MARATSKRVFEIHGNAFDDPKAAEAGRWEVVAALAAGLRAHRLASAGAVDLDDVRGKRGRP